MSQCICQILQNFDPEKVIRENKNVFDPFAEDNIDRQG